MWSLINTLSQIRYLIVLRVNSPIARVLPRFSSEISQVLGGIIANRLPSSEAKYWRKSAEYWSAYPELAAESYDGRNGRNRNAPAELRSIPSSPWPMETVLFPYPGKRSYGRGEPILLELKLLGDSADHSIFLELILPALEQASLTVLGDPANKYPLWGHFDIETIYVARGMNWEPIIQAGRLNLDYRPTAVQWAKGLSFKPAQHSRHHALLWLTPFEFEKHGIPNPAIQTAASGKRRKTAAIPTLATLLDALFLRVGRIITGKQIGIAEVRDMFSNKEREHFDNEITPLIQAANRRQTLEKVPKEWPECWLGVQRFPSIPASVLPFLRLASILHIGQHTHIGYGTFALR